MKRTVLYCFALTAALGLALPVAAEDELAISVGDKIARASWAHDWKKRDVQTTGTWEHHDDNGDVVSAGLLLPGLIGRGPRQTTLALGGKLLYADIFGNNGFALALGGEFAYPIPKHPALGLVGSAYFAPHVLASGDIRKYSEVSAGAAYHFGDHVGVSLVYRRVDVDLDAIAEPAFDAGLHIGFTFRF